MNTPCLQSKNVNWIEVRPNFYRRNLTFCLGLHNCRPFCCTLFQYNLQRGSPSNALPWFIYNISKSEKIYETEEKKSRKDMKRHVDCQKKIFRRNLFFNFYSFLEILSSNITANSSK